MYLSLEGTMNSNPSKPTKMQLNQFKTKIIDLFFTKTNPITVKA